MATDAVAAMPDSGVLRMRSFRDGDTHVIKLAGELDLASAADAERALRRVERSDAAIIAVDLSELTFIDSTGVHVILQSQRRTSHAPNRLVVVRGTSAVQRRLETCDVDSRLSFVDQVPYDPPTSSLRPRRSGTSGRVSQAALAASVRDLRTRRRPGLLR